MKPFYIKTASLTESELVELLKSCWGLQAEIDKDCHDIACRNATDSAACYPYVGVAGDLYTYFASDPEFYEFYGGDPVELKSFADVMDHIKGRPEYFDPTAIEFCSLKEGRHSIREYLTQTSQTDTQEVVDKTPEPSKEETLDIINPELKNKRLRYW
jgi:hypothetical protein